ncbi:MAG: transglutaminase-like cysteine peptidase [Sphingomonadales bacterium]
MTRSLPWLALTLALLSPSVATAETGLFGTRESRNGDLAMFTKWTGMLERARATGANTLTPRPAEDGNAPFAGSGACKPNPRFACPGADWPDMLQSWQALPPAQQVQRVNAYFNRAPYILDPVNWGVPDYWAHIREFFAKDGDCEDYAIAKYTALKALGFDPAAMRVVVVQDTNLDTAHAVLAVRWQGESLILDNQVDQVLADDRVHHYRPIYSINETAWWMHL